MILQILTLPEAFRITPGDSDSVVDLTAELLIERLLENVARNPQIVMIADVGPSQKSVILEGWLEEINKWPPKYRQSARYMLKELLKARRVVRVPSSVPNLRAAIQAAAKFLPDLVVVAAKEKTSCLEGITALEANGAEVSLPSDLSQTRFWRRRTKSSSWSLAPGEPAKDRIRDEVFIPLARHSSSFHVYDKYLGINAYNYLLNAVSRERIETFLNACLSGGPQTPLFQSSQDLSGEFRIYLEACEILIAAVQSFEDSSQRTIVFHTQLFNSRDRWKVDENVLRAVAFQLHKWALQVSSNLCAVSFDLVSPGDEDAHDRYLVTDQVNVTLGRGLGLWNHKGEAREINLTRIGTVVGADHYFSTRQRRFTETELMNPSFSL